MKFEELPQNYQLATIRTALEYRTKWEASPLGVVDAFVSGVHLGLKIGTELLAAESVEKEDLQ
jgi:hypothetical protein